VSERARVVAEVPVWLDVDGRRHATWTATPTELRELAAGRLLGDGFIRSAADLTAIDIVRDAPAGSIGLRAAVTDAEHGWQRSRHMYEHGCGVLGLVDCMDVLAPPGARGPVPPPELLAGLLRALFAAESDQRDERGGMHAAGIAVNGELRCVSHDVSRHSAVDKALGNALLDGMLPDHVGLVLSSRISGQIAAKAAVAGVTWVASRSIPTTLAVRIAAAAGLPLIGRAASADPVEHR
jgi:FdhD protein